MRDTQHNQNKSLVDSSDVIIACPYETQRIGTGRTWWGIYYAEKMNKPLTLIWRDGKVEKFYHPAETNG